VSGKKHSTVCTRWRSRNSRAASTLAAVSVAVTPHYRNALMRAIVLRSFHAPLEVEEIAADLLRDIEAEKTALAATPRAVK